MLYGKQLSVDIMKRIFWMILKLPIFLMAIPTLILIRLMRPWLLIRIGALFSHRIGHLAANTELYLCEKEARINVPMQRHLDLFFAVKPICNIELLNKWKQLIRVWPTWVLAPINRLNRLIPGWELHDIGQNSQLDRDIHHLFDRYPPHLKFSLAEEVKGVTGLRALGINPGAKFVCLNVRDSAYLESTQPTIDWSYHDYRDCNVQNFVMAAEELANLGFYVVRMGAVVKTTMQSCHPMVIDYAASGARTEFMDLYLGAKCEFCVSVGSGFDAIPYIFRRPIVFVNHVPVGYLFTFAERFIALTKHHFSVRLGRYLNLTEILAEDLGFAAHAQEYDSQGVKLIENTPEEIRDVVIEMVRRLEGAWQLLPDDEKLQKKFWSKFPSGALRNEKPLHGDIRSRFGAAFLRKNEWWLDAQT
jgi:putative glycosyltransferase (TIGR04372 family)